MGLGDRFVVSRVMLLLLSLAAFPQTETTKDMPVNSQVSGLKSSLDSATYLRLRVQLVPGIAERPACESDTPVGRKEEMQRAIKVFPEILKDTETFNAISPELCLDDAETFSDEDKLRVYRQYENLTSIHLEPLGKDSAGFDTYARAFVPNYQPHCDAAERKPTIVYAEHGVIVIRGFASTSLPPQHSSEHSAYDASPPQNRPLHRIKVRKPCHPVPDPIIQRVEMGKMYPEPRIPERLTYPELRYRLLEHFTHIWFCDPYGFWVERGWEQSYAMAALLTIKDDTETFSLITKHLGLNAGGEFSVDETVRIYREYKKLLRAVSIQPEGEVYRFRVAVKEDEGDFAIQGIVDEDGQITALQKEANFLVCQICVPANTTVDTAQGQVSLRDLQLGMMVWTFTSRGDKFAAPILKTSTIPVPPEHRLTRLTMPDAREVWVSPGLFSGTGTEQLTMAPDEGKTCDVLPGGPTGFYSGNFYGESTLSSYHPK
jgi:hypothetical protein